MSAAAAGRARASRLRGVVVLWAAMLWRIAGCALLLSLPVAAQSAAATASSESCAPTVLSVLMAVDPVPEKSLDGRQASAKPFPPATGWQAVTLPHKWPRMWGDSTHTAWYRIDWKSECRAADGSMQQVAVGLAAVSTAGALYSNDDLLWSDVSLVEPLSSSWNMPRWWLLPRTTLHSGVNTLWLRVTGLSQLETGVGNLYIGSPTQVREKIEDNIWRQRTAYLITAVLSGAVGSIFFVVYLIHRREHAYGWYALMSFVWVAYMWTLLATDSWPFAHVLSMTRASVILFIVYVACFCQFTWVFGGQSMPRLKKLLWAYALVCCSLTLLTPAEHLRAVNEFGWFSGVLIFILNCVQFQWHAWRTREPRHLLLAGCWLAFIVVAIHDLVLTVGVWRGGESLSAISGPIATVFMALLLGSQLGSQMRRIARFNDDLKIKVSDARLDLARALEREHVQRLQHAKAQERLEIAHDLHDGLGASLVRSMAIVEQAGAPMTNERVLSLLKVLRDDLRQVIDYGSSAGASVPETPVEWMAPLRYRFTNILDDLNIASEWIVPPQWIVRPSAVQCLALTRVVEEALSNIIKHSRAHHVRVTCSLSDDAMLTLDIEDDGAGFDVAAVRRAGLSVGLRSMEARTRRMGAEFHVHSRPGDTALQLVLPLSQQGESAEATEAAASVQ